MSAPRLLAPRLLVVTTPAVDVVDAVSAALRVEDPRVCIQLRDKRASADELSALARELLPVCRRAGAQLVINGRADVARDVEADGVHLPERGLSVAEARRLVGPSRLIGRSCHDRDGLERASRDGADYATLSPFGQVPGKGRPLGIQGFDLADMSIPVLALGGVRADDVQPLRAAGVHGVAVCRAVLQAEDKALEMRRLLDALGRE